MKAFFCLLCFSVFTLYAQEAKKTFVPFVGWTTYKGENIQCSIPRVSEDRTQVWLACPQKDFGGWVPVTDIGPFTRVLMGLMTTEEAFPKPALVKPVSQSPTDFSHIKAPPRSDEAIALERLADEQAKANAAQAAQKQEQARARLQQEQQARMQREMLELMRREAEIRELRLQNIEPPPLRVKR